MERRTKGNTSTTTLKVSGLADFQKGNHPDEWNKEVWTASDHLGTVTLHLSAQGFVLKKSYYTPFGETAGTEDAKARYRYCGKEKDSESGLYYYGARYYATWLCRFVSVDPLAEKALSWSPYTYCLDNPIFYIDKDGKEPTPAEAARIAAHLYGDKKDSILTGGWRVSHKDFGIQFSNESGFESIDQSSLKSAVYERVVNGKVTEYVYATAGSNDSRDWYENASQPIGLSEQYKKSADIAQNLSLQLKKSELTFVGHSLGGGEAALNSMLTYGDGPGRKAITFNAAGVGLLTKFFKGSITNIFNSEVSWKALLINGDNITAFVLRTDPLNNLQDALFQMPDVNGKRYDVMPKFDAQSLLNGHHMDNFLKIIGVNPEDYQK